MDSNETSLPDVDVWMIHADLNQIPSYELPAGYSFRFYCDGDLEKWVKIQNAADELFTATAETFKQSLKGPADYLAHRIMFLVNQKGEDIGTITAWETEKLTGNLLGQVHWVAIVPEAQGQGLAKPMMTAVCRKLLELGHSKAFLSTNTRRIPALNLYLGMGFKPFKVGANEAEAWETVRPLLKVNPFG